jgi:hypothetical protein
MLQHSPSETTHQGTHSVLEDSCLLKTPYLQSSLAMTHSTRVLHALYNIRNELNVDTTESVFLERMRSQVSRCHCISSKLTGLGEAFLQVH